MLFSNHPNDIKTNKKPPKWRFLSGGSGWSRTSSVIRQQIYSLPRLSDSGARPISGASSGTRTRISSLEGLRTSPCTMLATNSKLYYYILKILKCKRLFYSAQPALCKSLNILFKPHRYMYINNPNKSTKNNKLKKQGSFNNEPCFIIIVLPIV